MSLLRIHLVDFVCLHSEHLRRNRRFFELFSGQGNLTKAFQERGDRASKYDWVDDPDCDFGSTRLVQQILSGPPKWPLRNLINTIEQRP